MRSLASLLHALIKRSSIRQPHLGYSGRSHRYPSYRGCMPCCHIPIHRDTQARQGCGKGAATCSLMPTNCLDRPITSAPLANHGRGPLGTCLPLQQYEDLPEGRREHSRALQHGYRHVPLLPARSAVSRDNNVAHDEYEGRGPLQVCRCSARRARRFRAGGDAPRQADSSL